MTQAYAGIGSRQTPNAIIAQMKMIAALLAPRYTLRSGGAKPPAPVMKPKPDTDSADLAFEAGCDSVKGRKVIRCTSLKPEALIHAARYHPNWDACDEHARSLHARNSLIMFGDTLDDPVRFVVCYTDGGGKVGGTGQALRIAAQHNIPVYNLFNMPFEHFWEWERSL